LISVRIGSEQSDDFIRHTTGGVESWLVEYLVPHQYHRHTARLLYTIQRRFIGLPLEHTGTD